MSSIGLFRSLSLGAVLLGALTLRAQASDKVLLDFGDVRQDPGEESVMRCYDHVWNDWEHHVTDKRRVGAIIRCKTAKGNLGESNTNVDFGKTPALQFDYVVIAGNEAKAIAFHLIDADGTDAFWNLPLDSKPGVALGVRLDLSKPTTIKTPGKHPGLDAKHIAEWSVQGDYSDTPVGVILLKVKAVQ